MPAGRPRSTDSNQRRAEFVRLIQSGEEFAAAAREARLSPVRALAILGEQPEVRQIVAHFLGEDLAA